MVLQENIAGVRVVKAFAQRRHEEERFETANEAFTEMHIRIMRFHSSFSPALTMLINLAIVLVVWMGGFQSIKGNLSLGAIVAFTDYLMTALAPLTLLVMLSNALAAGIALIAIGSAISNWGAKGISGASSSSGTSSSSSSSSSSSLSEADEKSYYVCGNTKNNNIFNNSNSTSISSTPSNLITPGLNLLIPPS